MATADLQQPEWRIERYLELSDHQLHERMLPIVWAHASYTPSHMPDFVHDHPAALWVAQLACRNFETGMFAPKAQVLCYASFEAHQSRDILPKWVVAIRVPTRNHEHNNIYAQDPVFNRSFGVECSIESMPRALCAVAAMAHDVWAWRREHNKLYTEITQRAWEPPRWDDDHDK